LASSVVSASLFPPLMDRDLLNASLKSNRECSLRLPGRAQRCDEARAYDRGGSGRRAMGRSETNRRKGIGKSVVRGVCFRLVMLALMWYASVSLGQQSGEVCIAYEGRSACRKAEGTS